MYVITVTFDLAPEHIDAFRPAILAQAQNSLQREKHCHQFDVCFDPEQPHRCFLYEKYTDRAAFDAHLQTDHFRSFGAAVAPWVVSKAVQAWNELPSV